ncbi:MAG: hypothetical protein WC492_03770 [Candidatus Micrarchaeia archaeon]
MKDFDPNQTNEKIQNITLILFLVIGAIFSCFWLYATDFKDYLTPVILFGVAFTLYFFVLRSRIKTIIFSLRAK